MKLITSILDWLYSLGVKCEIKRDCSNYGRKCHLCVCNEKNPDTADWDDIYGYWYDIK